MEGDFEYYVLILNIKNRIFFIRNTKKLRLEI